MVASSGAGFDGQTVDLSCDTTFGSPTTVQCLYEIPALTTDDPRRGTESIWTVRLDALDAAGNPLVTTREIMLDFRAPAPAFTNDATLVPDDNNPLTAPAALRAGGAAQLVVSFDEAVDLDVASAASATSVSCEGFTPTTSTQVASVNPLVATVTLDSAAPGLEGRCDVIVRAPDLAGNVFDDVVGSFDVDTAPPLAADVDQGAIKHLRAPWGATQTGASPGQFLVPETLGASDSPIAPLPASAFIGVDTLARIDAFTDELGGLLIGSSTVEGGAVGAMPLQGEDSDEVWLSVIDRAGNASPRIRVDQVEWVATLDDSSSTPNPHRLVSHIQAPVGPGAQPVNAPIDAQPAGREDGNAVSVESGIIANAISENQPQYLSYVAYDSLHDAYYAPAADALYVFERNRWAPTAVDSLYSLSGLQYDPFLDSLLVNDSFGLIDVVDEVASAPEYVALPNFMSPAINASNGRRFVLSLPDNDTPFLTQEVDEALARTPLAAGGPVKRNHAQVIWAGPLAELFMFGGYHRDFPTACPDGAPTAATLDAGGDCIFTETWTFDGQTWTERTDGTGPPPRKRAAIGYDPKRQHVVLFGGSSPFADGTGVSSLDPCTYDPTTTFETGALGPSLVAFCELRDTWIYDASGWRQHAGNAPPRRSGASLVYNRSLDGLVLMGGSALNVPQGRWLFKDETWTPLPDSLEDPPENARHGKLAYAEARDVAVMVEVSNGTTQIYEGGRWRAVADTLLVSQCLSWPFETEGGGPFLFDPILDRFIYVDHCVTPMRTWLLDPVTWTWSEASGAAPTGERLGAGATYHEPWGRVVLFGGGADARAPADDTWSFDGIGWVEETSVGPGAATAHNVMLTDSDGRAVRIGVLNFSGPFLTSGDGQLFRLGAADWEPISGTLSMSLDRFSSFFRATTRHLWDL